MYIVQKQQRGRMPQYINEFETRDEAEAFNLQLFKNYLKNRDSVDYFPNEEVFWRDIIIS